MTDFGKNKAQRDGLDNTCLNCRHANYRIHPEKMLAQNRTHRRRTRERVNERNRLWHKQHPEKARIRTARRRARRNTLPFAYTDTDWTRCLNWWYGACAYCGNPPSLWDNPRVLHQDHFIPQSPNYDLIGSNPGYVPTNIVPACQSCNKSKGHNDPIEWLTERFGKRKAAKILKRINAYFEWIKGQK